MTPPDRRTLVQQALRGTGFVIAIATSTFVVAIAIAWVFIVVMT